MSFYHLFDSLQECVFVIDADGNCHYGNPAASIMSEVSVKRLSSGKPLSQYIVFEPNPLKSIQLQSLKEPSQLQEVQFKLGDGRTGWIQVIFQEAPSGFSGTDQPRWILTTRDVTLEKQLHAKYQGELDQKQVVIEDLRTAREKLEHYSKKLEEMVAERTRELRSTNTLLKSILDSLGQGILVFDRSGKCLNVYSQICRKLFGTEPAGLPAEAALGLTGSIEKEFAQWRDTVFAEMLDFEDMAPLALNRIPNQIDHEIFLTYHPIREPAGALSGIVVVATDRTQEVRAQKAAKSEHELAERVIQISRNPESYRLFASESKRVLSQILNWPENGVPVETVARWVHTIKGGAASFFLQSVVEACDRYEDLLELFKSQMKAVQLPTKTGSLGFEFHPLANEIANRLSADLDGIRNLIGVEADESGGSALYVKLQKLKDWSQRLSQDSSHAKAVSEELRSEFDERPVQVGIQQLDSALQRLAHSLGKEVMPLKIEGGETRVPNVIAREFIGSLVHAVNNSVYHGIESPTDRLAAGKPRAGTVGIRFERIGTIENDSSWLQVEVYDDGRGLDPAVLRRKLLEKEPESNLSDHEVLQCILRDDFSTAEAVGSVAGRGVGLAAIANEARRLGGTVFVKSQKGLGMTLEIRVQMQNSSEEDRSASLAQPKLSQAS